MSKVKSDLCIPGVAPGEMGDLSWVTVSGRGDTQTELVGEDDGDFQVGRALLREKRIERQCMESKRVWLVCGGFLANGAPLAAYIQ